MNTCCKDCRKTVIKNRPLKQGGGYPVYVCNNSNCPCHSALPQETRDKLERGAKDFAERFEGVMRDLTPKWEKQFEEDFGYLRSIPAGCEMGNSDVDDIKSFITRLLSTQREEADKEADMHFASGKACGREEAQDKTRLWAVEVLHLYAMKTKDTAALDLIEQIQRHILNFPTRLSPPEV